MPAPLWSLLLEVRRPGDAGEPQHEERHGDAVGRVPRQPDGKEAEYERARASPEPDVLMKHVQDGHGEHGQESTSHWCQRLQLNVYGGTLYRC